MLSKDLLTYNIFMTHFFKVDRVYHPRGMIKVNITNNMDKSKTNRQTTMKTRCAPRCDAL